MDRREFIAELRREMSGGFSTAEIEDAVSYYEDYIDMQIKKGKREDEVLRQLGSPRLIAKSMKAAGRGTGGAMGGRAGRYASGGSAFFNEEPSRDEDTDSDGRMHTFRIPLWLVLLIVLFVLIVVLSFVFRLLIAVLPILLVVIGVIAIYRYFQRR